jgi:glucose/arabinose dehydrogenase
MAFAPDGRLFVTEQSGRVRVVRDGAPLATPFLTLPVDATVERGLLGVAFAPDFETSGHVYVYYTRAGPDGPLDQVSRFTASPTQPDVALPASEVVILGGIPSAPFHNGGALHFAADGTLLVAVGDGEDSSEAQLRTSLLGKILRLGADGRIPRDNPFVGEAGTRPEIWAYGFRNPFTFAVEPGSGRVFINDVGVATSEEIDEGAAGGNYGWPGCEGPCGQEHDPIYYYNHSQGCAITGGSFGAGLRFPAELGGSYYFSDFCGRWIRRLTPDLEAVEFARDMDGDAVDIDVGPDGQLYYLSYGLGEVRRIVYIGEGNRQPVAALAASRLGGPAPLTVTLSAEGSQDPDGDPLSFSWDFGDGTAPAAGPARVDHVFAARGPYAPRVTVSDPRGGQASARIRLQVGQPPTARILDPPAGATFRPSQVVRYAGEAEDATGRPLTGDSLVWTIVLHHHPEGDPLHHTHPFLGPLFGASGSFTIPDVLHDTDIFLRLHLSATDADGLSVEVTRDIVPAP